MPKINNISALKNAAFGEVVQNKIDQILIECWASQDAAKIEIPAFAGLVKIISAWGTAFACVHAINTESRFASGKGMAFGLTSEQLKIEQPQVFDFIVTTLEAKVFAYVENNDTRQQLLFGVAPRPAEMHAFAYLLEDFEWLNLIKQPMFFFYILKSLSSVADVDAIAFSLVARLTKLQKLDDQFFEHFYAQYSRLPEVTNEKARLLFLAFEQLLL